MGETKRRLNKLYTGGVEFVGLLSKTCIRTCFLVSVSRDDPQRCIVQDSPARTKSPCACTRAVRLLVQEDALHVSSLKKGRMSACRWPARETTSVRGLDWGDIGTLRLTPGERNGMECPGSQMILRIQYSPIQVVMLPASLAVKTCDP